MSRFPFCLNVFLFSLIKGGVPLKCYTCSSTFDGYCDNLHNPRNKHAAMVEDCLGPNAWCYHFVHNVEITNNYATVVRRGCTFERACDVSQEPVTRVCLTCGHDYCNNATLYHKPTSPIKSRLRAIMKSATAHGCLPSILIIYTCFVFSISTLMFYTF